MNTAQLVESSPDVNAVTFTDVSENVIDEVAAFLKRFVFFKDVRMYHFVAAWIISTHLVHDFEYTGYLFVYSPEPRSGKSRFLEVLETLVFNSSEILIEPTKAVLFRSANGKTQLIDEVDSIADRESLRAVLNAGFKKGGKVSRYDSKGNGSLTKNDFRVYGPRALAGIGVDILDETTKDRTFMIPMVRQTPTERREKFRRPQHAEAAGIKKKIEKWVADHREEILALYNAAHFPYLDPLNDRTIDISEPIAAVVEVASGGDSEPRKLLLEAIAVTRNEQNSGTSASIEIITKLAELAKSSPSRVLVGMPSELAERITGLREQPSPGAISEALRHFGFKKRSDRGPDGKPRYRYLLPLEELQEIVARYGSGSDSSL